MKIWITRPSVPEVVTRGVGRCTLWLSKPFFDRTPRGERDPGLFAKLPIGWRVIDPDTNTDVTGQMTMPVEKRLRPYPELQSALWSAIVANIDGGSTDSSCYGRWESDPKILWDDQGHDTFLFEVDAPPQLWWALALENGWEVQTWPSRWFQDLQTSDVPF
jgi:hypothetical protein